MKVQTHKNGKYFTVLTLKNTKKYNLKNFITTILPYKTRTIVYLFRVSKKLFYRSTLDVMDEWKKDSFPSFF